MPEQQLKPALPEKTNERVIKERTPDLLNRLGLI